MLFCCQILPLTFDYHQGLKQFSVHPITREEEFIMKIAFTLLSSLIFISAATANDKSRLTINVAGKAEFEIVIDNKSYTTEGNALLLTDLKPGYHTIKVYRIRGGRGSSVRMSERNELLNTTTIKVKAGYHVDVIINRFGKALVDEQAMITLQKQPLPKERSEIFRSEI
jgi:hypothetical protein